MLETSLVPRPPPRVPTCKHAEKCSFGTNLINLKTCFLVLVIIN